MEIKLKKLHPLAIVPTKNKGDAGYDLYATEDYILQPLERKLFKTGWAISIPEGYYGRIAPRSGLAYKNGIDVMAGVIDSTYRNDIGVILINLNAHNSQSADSGSILDIMMRQSNPSSVPTPYPIKCGDKIAQIIIEKCHDVDLLESDTLDETDRGLNGFGSSGR